MKEEEDLRELVVMEVRKVMDRKNINKICIKMIKLRKKLILQGIVHKKQIHSGEAVSKNKIRIT